MAGIFMMCDLWLTGMFTKLIPTLISMPVLSLQTVWNVRRGRTMSTVKSSQTCWYLRKTGHERVVSRSPAGYEREDNGARIVLSKNKRLPFIITQRSLVIWLGFLYYV